MIETKLSTKILIFLVVITIAAGLFSIMSFSVIEFVITGRVPGAGLSVTPLLMAVLVVAFLYVLVDVSRALSTEMLISRLEQAEAERQQLHMKQAEETVKEEKQQIIDTDLLTEDFEIA